MANIYLPRQSIDTFCKKLFLGGVRATQPEPSKKELHCNHFQELAFSRLHFAVALDRQNKIFYGKCIIYLIPTVCGKTTYEWHTDDIQVYTSDRRMTCEYIRVTYGYHAITYEWHMNAYEWHTDNIRVHTSDIRVHTSVTRMAYK